MSKSYSQIRFILHNSLTELERLSEQLDIAAELWQLPSRAALQINLIMDELFTNTVSYGVGDATEKRVNICMDYNGNEVQIVMIDDGHAFDPSLPNDPILDIPLEERDVGGLGIFLARKYADKLTYMRENGKNIVKLIKTIT